MPLKGIDASRHQGVVDWKKVKAAGNAFAFIKATEGTSYGYTDWYRTNSALVRNAGLVLGAYHFLRADRDPAAQARYYRGIVSNFSGVVPIVDVETAANGTKPQIQHVRGFIGEFRRLVPNRAILIYTGRWYWVGHMGNPTGSDLGPLWHSEYETSQAEINDGPELDNYGGWPRATVWQYTSSGSCPGINGNCDLNYYYGTLEQLRGLAGIAVTKDWFDMATEADLRRVVREELTAQRDDYANRNWLEMIPQVDETKEDAPAQSFLRHTNNDVGIIRKNVDKILSHLGIS